MFAMAEVIVLISRSHASMTYEMTTAFKYSSDVLRNVEELKKLSLEKKCIQLENDISSLEIMQFCS